MPLYTMESGLIFGVAGIIVTFILTCLCSGNYLESQLLTHWKGEMASRLYLTPIKKMTSNYLVALLLDGILAAICIVTLGLAGGIVVLIILFILDKRVFAAKALRHNLRKALEEGKYNTEVTGNDEFTDKVSATLRVQLKFLVEHPKSALLMATIDAETAKRYRDGLYMMANPNSITAVDEKIFVFFLKYPYTADGQKLVKKEIEDAKKRTSTAYNKKPITKPATEEMNDEEF